MMILLFLLSLIELLICGSILSWLLNFNLISLILGIRVRLGFLILTLGNLNLVFLLFKSSHRGCSLRKGVLRNFAKFARKHLCKSLTCAYICLRPQDCNPIKKEALAQVFYCEFCKFSKNTFLKITSERLLLNVQSPGATGVKMKGPV